MRLKDRLRYRTRAQRSEKMWLLGKSFRRFDVAAWGVTKSWKCNGDVEELAEVHGPVWRINGEYVTGPCMSLRTCTVSYCDLKGVEHAIEVTADSLYEAVAQGLLVFRETIGSTKLGHGQTTISVVVRQPKVQHKVRVQDFERWLETQGRTPAEMSLKARLRELLSEVTRAASRTARNRT